MTALALALAFTSALAFAGWVLWLRERRGDLITDRIAVLEQAVDQIEDIAAKVPALEAQVSDLVLKAGFRGKP